MALTKIMQKTDIQIMQKTESIHIKPSSMVAPLLKQFSAGWIDGICDMLNINAKHYKAEKIQSVTHTLTSADSLYKIVSELTDSEQAVLQFVLKKGGIVKTRKLERRFGQDDTSGAWKHVQTSTIRKLRRRGLLIVGKARIKAETHKAAVIPADVAKILKPFLW